MIEFGCIDAVDGAKPPGREGIDLMMRSTVLGGLAGLLVAALLMGTFALSNGVSEDLYAPLLVMGVPIVVLGLLTGVCAGAGGLRTPSRGVVRAVAFATGLVIFAVALKHLGVI